MDAIFEEMSLATDRQLWEGEPELSTREKVLLSLVADVCLQTLGVPYEQHVRMAHEHGVGADDLRELLRFIAYDSGYPAARAALARLEEIEKEYGLPQPTGRGHDLDLAGTGSPIPAQIRDEVHALDDRFGDYMDLQSRMRAGMSLLPVRERAFATITVDVLFQTLEESLRTHVGRALSAGAPPEAVRAVVRFSARFGMTKAWRALHVVDGLLAASS